MSQYRGVEVEGEYPGISRCYVSRLCDHQSDWLAPRTGRNTREQTLIYQEYYKLAFIEVSWHMRLCVAKL